MDKIDPDLHLDKEPQLSTVLYSSLLLHTFFAMSEAEASASVGNKRPRDDGDDALLSNGNGVAAGDGEMPSADLDDSDDEIGPMPDAPVEVSKGRKKKRAVLSHERIYLENIPDTDRYTKSFMHRADINFVTMTKSVYNPILTEY